MIKRAPEFSGRKGIFYFGGGFNLEGVLKEFPVTWKDFPGFLGEDFLPF